MKQNCIINNCAEKVRLFNIAISTKENVFVKPYGSNNIGMTKVVFDKDSNTYSIKAQKLDDFYDELIDCSLIKIDVEGNEMDVLKSCEKVLKHRRPLVVLETMYDKFVEVNDYLTSFGYKIVKKFDFDPNVYLYKASDER